MTTRKRYSKEYKLDAISLVLERNVQQALGPGVPAPASGSGPRSRGRRTTAGSGAGSRA